MIYLELGIFHFIGVHHHATEMQYTELTENTKLYILMYMNAEYYEEMGVKDRKILICGKCIDFKHLVKFSGWYSHGESVYSETYEKSLQKM